MQYSNDVCRSFLDYAKERYCNELNRVERLRTEASILITLMGILAAAEISLLADIGITAIGWHYAFLIITGLVGIIFLLLIYFFYRFFFCHEYMLPKRPKDLKTDLHSILSDLKKQYEKSYKEYGAIEDLNTKTVLYHIGNIYAQNVETNIDSNNSKAKIIGRLGKLILALIILMTIQFCIKNL